MSDVKMMRALAEEAYDTVVKMHGFVGPKSFGNNWPDMIQEFSEVSVKIRPTAEAISRSDKFWDTFNDVLEEEQRQSVLEWLRIKRSKNRTIKGWCEKNGLFEHNYRRKIDKIFQLLVLPYKFKNGLIYSDPVDEPKFSGRVTAQSDEVTKVPWDEESPSHKRLVKKLLNKMKKRDRGRRAANG